MKAFIYTLLFSLAVFISTNTHCQNIVIKDINLRGRTLNYRTTPNSFNYTYKVLRKQNQLPESFFRTISFDTLLNLQDTILMKVPGNVVLISSAQNSDYLLTAFGSKETGSVTLCWYNLATRTQKVFPLKRTWPWSKKLTVQLLTTQNPEVFCVIFQENKTTTEIQFINAEGKTLSRKPIGNGTRPISVTEALHLNNKILLLIATDYTNRKVKYELKIIDSQTGEELQSKKLSDKEQKFAIDNAIVKDSTIYFPGRKYLSNKIKNNKPGVPVLVSFNFNLGEYKEQALNSTPINQKYFWMDIVKNQNGEKFLVGETFTSEPYGAYLAKAMISAAATLGMFYVTWSTLTFEGVITLPIDNSNSKPMLINLAPRKVRVGSYLPAYTFAAYAARTGQVRYFGHSNAGNLFLLNGPIMISRDISSPAFKKLGRLPAAYPTSLFTSETYMIIFNQNNQSSKVQFDVFKFSLPENEK
jgi:ribosomal protein S6